MNWSNTASSVLIVLASLVMFAGIAASVAIFLQIIRQGGWKIAEPSVIKSRWQMVRPWMLVGAVLGLLTGIALVALNRDDETAPTVQRDVVSPPVETRTMPREGGQTRRGE